ncbi:response regulator [Acidobacteriota bacterium]
MRIFIADDSEELCSRLVEILSEIRGLQIVGVARNKKEALDGIAKHKPDVVILDIRMPDGNGISVLNVIKKQKRPPLAIMFTNYPYLQYRKKCLEDGADFFFYKALEFEKMIDLINDLFKKYQANILFS